MIAIILNRIHFTASFSHPSSFRISNAQRFPLRLFWIIFFEQFYLIDFNAPWANARIGDFQGVHIRLNFIRFAYVYLHLFEFYEIFYEKYSIKNSIFPKTILKFFRNLQKLFRATDTSSQINSNAIPDIFIGIFRLASI